ncbi:O-antigen ligase family protein [Haloarcula sp. JP-Z28]|uniref:O-antigen ligase family protein n=1 Tax=Haloarcula sp. JP-Z28 TaxID=2716715 RepID=UPI0014051A50|nr:O-antigen ligase family protein [Haloarcula sp. JP-Z28]NHN65598.1 O-antigen ligase family protein [Haloarcula sp. JP-Z28]
MAATDHGQSSRLRVYAVLIVLSTIPLIAKIPLKGNLIIIGQLPVGSAVVTPFDIYLLALTIISIALHQKAWIPKTLTVLSFIGIVVASSISLVLNGVRLQGIIETIQWIQMGIFTVAIGLLLQSERDIQYILEVLVKISSIKAIWTIIYFVIYGYPGRRFNALVEGAALVILIGLIIQDCQDWSLNLHLIPLAGAVLISQERKVWVALVVSSFAITALYATSGNRRKILKMLPWFLAGFLVLLFAAGFLLPSEILARMGTLFSILPWVGDPVQFERLYVYRTGLEIFQHNPIFGVGPDGWYQTANMYGTDNFIDFQKRTKNVYVGPHSIFIKVLSEIGAVGFMFFLLLVVQPFRFAGYYIKRDSTSRASNLGMTMFAFYIYVLFYASVYSSSTLIRVYMFLPFGILLSLDLHNEPGNTKNEQF